MTIQGVEWIGSWTHLYSTYGGYGCGYSAMYGYKAKLDLGILTVKELKRELEQRGVDVNFVGKK